MQNVVIKSRSGKYKKRIWIISILIVLIVVVTGIMLLMARWKPLLSQKLKDGVYNRSFNLYKLDFKDISINLLTGSIELQDVSLVPDTSVYNQFRKLRVAPANIFEVKLERLQLNRVALLTAYFKREVEIKSIVLENPSINVTHYKVEKLPEELEKEDQTLYDLISNRVKSIDVKRIKIIDADFDYINGDNFKKIHSVKHLSINVNDFLLDSVSQFDTTRYYYAKDIGFELTGYKSISKDKMYTIKVDTIRGSALHKSIDITGVQMIPMYPDLAFSRKYTYGKDRYDLKFNTISLEGVNFALLDAEEKLQAKALKIGPAKVNIFVNRELPPPPNLDKVRNFPHMALKRLPIPTVVDTVKLTNIDLAYTEYNPISQKRGTVYFQNLSGRILNVTNDTLQLTKNNHAVANLTALVMKTSRINVQINFNLTDKNAAFSYNGNVAPMNLQALNPMAKNMGLVEIESGQMQKLDFNIHANAKGSSGKVHFYYTDLKIKLLKEGENGMAPKKKGFLSFLANKLLIEDANPIKGEAARTSNVTFQRTPAASFFNLMWKSIFIGMRETVGLGIVPVKTPEQAMDKIKDKKEERRKEKEATKKN
ncbi:hypothetical protein FBD94_15545 [Pedobacter hiemivivus]|uniref:DUF748 domain-containing protein n=1 Tax=Pedobacter hiemivivus TaxID=2530454 RepID=A0A4U1G9H5_9SPHI|nr:hypothetical protein [Pedobacter hiemivivus]TKC60318.1 hypothetical protein FBD94_15545 [Pedobacter hiemivivus]